MSSIGGKRKVVVAVIAGLALTIALAGVSTGAVPGQVYAAPGAAAAGYANRTVVILKGSPLTLYNYDTVRHDVVSSAGLFRSALIGFLKSAPVAGVKALPRGTYYFYCSLHRGTMKGSLVVL